MAVTIMTQRLIIFIIFARIIIASPLDIVYKTSIPSKIEPVKRAVDFNDGIHGGPTVHTFDPDVLQYTSDEVKPVLVEDGEVQVDITQIGIDDEVLSSLNEINISIFSDQSHVTSYEEDNIEPNGQVAGDLHTTDKSVENTFTSQEISDRDTTEAMGYHNYAMVCAQSKVHTDYCANRRRGYYCSQNGFLQIHADGTRYVPCEDQCVCVDIGIKPVCRPMQLLGAGSRTNC